MVSVTVLLDRRILFTWSVNAFVTRANVAVWSMAMPYAGVYLVVVMVVKQPPEKWA